MESIGKQLQELEMIFGQLAEQAADDDAAVYRCPLCRDSGYIVSDGSARICDCRRPQHLRASKTVAGLTPRLQRMNFGNFDLRLYPETLRTPQGASYRQLAERALHSAQAFVRECAAHRLPPGMLIEGAVGSGKTHLAASMANRLVEQGIDVQFFVVPEFLDQLRASYRRENEGLDEADIIRRAYDVPVLLFDDMGAHNFTAWVENKLFTIINHRYNYQLPTVITTNLDVNELHQNIGERTVSRLLETCAMFKLSVDQDLRLKQNPAGRRL